MQAKIWNDVPENRARIDSCPGVWQLLSTKYKKKKTNKKEDRTYFTRSSKADGLMLAVGQLFFGCLRQAGLADLGAWPTSDTRAGYY